MTATRIAASVLAFATCAAAQTNSAAIAGPVLGLVLDTNSSLRPVWGIPGAAMLGQALAVDPALNIAAIAPHHDYLLALRSDDQSVVVLGNPLGGGGSAPIGGTAGTQSIVLSPVGRAALLQPASGTTWTVVTGLPDAPSIAWQMDASALPSAPAAVIISDDGKAVLAMVSNASGGRLYLSSPPIAARANSRMSGNPAEWPSSRTEPTR